MMTPSERPFTPTEAAEFLHLRLGDAWDPQIAEIEERSDGNVNVVFIVTCGERRAVIKQALPFARIAPEWPIPPERVGREAALYRHWARAAPGSVPLVYDEDPDACVITMEYLDECALWRDEILSGRAHPEAAADLGRTLARTAFRTSMYALENDEFQRALADSGNPALERLMEDVLFLQPWVEHDRNEVVPSILGRWEAACRNGAFRDRVAVLHRMFRTHREVFAHGDLHTGSIMVGNGRARAFDAEFARYAPAGFDLGEFWGNALLAAIGTQFGRPGTLADFLSLITNSWKAYSDELRQLWPARVLPVDDAACELWLEDTLGAAAGFAGLELARRQVGLGRLPELEALPRVQADAARSAALLIGVQLVLTDPRNAMEFVQDAQRLIEAA